MNLRTGSTACRRRSRSSASARTDLWYCASSCPRTRASSTSSRSCATGSERVDPRPAQPAAGATTRSAPTRSRRAHGYAAPGVDAAPTPAARPGHARGDRARERRARRRPRTSRSTCRRASAAAAATRCSSCTTAHDYLRYASAADRARQPDPPARDPAADRGAHAVARPARASTPATTATRASSPRSCPAQLEARLPAAAGPGGARPDGRELRRRRLAARRVALPGRVRPAAAAVGLVRVHRHRPPPPRGPVFDPVVALRERVPRDARAGRPSACTSSLRHLRVADLREPLAGAAAAAAPAWRYATSRPATATTGRTGATGCARALLALPRAAVDGLRVSERTRGEDAWRTSHGTSGCRSAPTSAGRSASRRS